MNESGIGIDTRSLSDRVYDYLSDRIIEGAIQYGQNLNIKEIAETLKVSTMPVREAVKRMEMEGVVRITPRSNCCVRIPTKKSILDAFEMRQLIEIHSLSKVYRSVKRADLQDLTGIIERMDSIVAVASNPDSLRQYIKLDRLFHDEICRLSDNEYLDKFCREINLHLNMTYTYGIGVPPDVPRTFADHKSILERLSQNSAEAVAILTRHLKRSGENILNGEVFQSLG